MSQVFFEGLGTQRKDMTEIETEWDLADFEIGMAGMPVSRTAIGSTANRLYLHSP